MGGATWAEQLGRSSLGRLGGAEWARTVLAEPGCPCGFLVLSCCLFDCLVPPLGLALLVPGPLYGHSVFRSACTVPSRCLWHLFVAVSWLSLWPLVLVLLPLVSVLWLPRLGFARAGPSGQALCFGMPVRCPLCASCSSSGWLPGCPCGLLVLSCVPLGLALLAPGSQYVHPVFWSVCTVPCQCLLVPFWHPLGIPLAIFCLSSGLSSGPFGSPGLSPAFLWHPIGPLLALVHPFFCGMFSRYRDTATLGASSVLLAELAFGMDLVFGHLPAK